MLNAECCLILANYPKKPYSLASKSLLCNICLMSLPFRSRPSRTKALDKTLSSLFLLGGEFPSENALRIVELGCGFGDALLHNALRFPQHSFIGVEINKECLLEARQVADSYSIKNIAFIESSLIDFSLSDKKADIILCHGLYSWCDDDLRDAIKNLIKASLSDKGIAIISSAIEPGFIVRKVISDWLSFSKNTTPRKALNDLVQSVPFEFERPFGLLLHRELTRLSTESDAYIEAELLSKKIKSYYLKDLVNEISSTGLHYIGDVRIQRSPRTEGEDNIIKEMKYDFANGTAFRESIFSKIPAKSIPEIPANWWISPSLESLQVEEELHPIQEKLRQSWPKAVPYGELVAAFPNELDTLKEIVYSERADLSFIEIPVVDSVPDKPFIPIMFKTHRINEWSNVRYDPVELGTFEDALALLCDGKRTKADLAKEVKVMMGADAPDDETIKVAIEEGLITIMTAGLLLQT